jgi:hypothetical protein
MFYLGFFVDIVSSLLNSVFFSRYHYNHDFCVTLNTYRKSCAHVQNQIFALAILISIRKSSLNVNCLMIDSWIIFGWYRNEEFGGQILTALHRKSSIALISDFDGKHTLLLRASIPYPDLFM